MEHQLWNQIVAFLKTNSKARPRSDVEFSDQWIVAVYYWAVLHDRPISWAVNKCNWPICLRRHALPSNSTMSRRLRSAPVKALLWELEQHWVRTSSPDGLVWLLDGKPLTISGVSKDPHAGYGRAARAKAKGYKMHVLMGTDNFLVDWRLAPMHVDERKIGGRMLRSAKLQGYIVADANYDSNKLHGICDERGNMQLITQRRYGPHKGTGHRKQTAGRLRSKAILEDPFPEFGEDLLDQRSDIERRFGEWTSWGGGLMPLPPWVRTYPRVHRWVQAKLVIWAVKKRLKQTTCAA